MAMVSMAVVKRNLQVLSPSVSCRFISLGPQRDPARALWRASVAFGLTFGWAGSDETTIISGRSMFRWFQLFPPNFSSFLKLWSKWIRLILHTVPQPGGLIQLLRLTRRSGEV